MKKITVFLFCFILSACAPVLNKDLMREGQRNVPMEAFRTNPDLERGKLFILGGVIVDTRFVQDGSQVEVLSLSVDARGYPEDGKHASGRFLAIYPKEAGLLDPVVYKKGRIVTLAGVFSDLRKSKIDDMEYVYPVFQIRQIHLWEEEAYYGYYPYYYGYPYYPYYYPYGFYSPYRYHSYWGPPSPGWW